MGIIALIGPVISGLQKRQFSGFAIVGTAAIAALLCCKLADPATAALLALLALITQIGG